MNTANEFPATILSVEVPVLSHKNVVASEESNSRFVYLMMSHVNIGRPQSDRLVTDALYLITDCIYIKYAAQFFFGIYTRKFININGQNDSESVSLTLN